ncbi:hypothetical protein HMPREF9141_0016 [Prevotella multiformis DSM 16608]|uniref:Uncharacterized protein n=1 Tax=Prevotella multiformis DSM 16608 TaxID=888743 RepID=F0F350_9BACT|nr:hypothetical protein HMPREF9141_0016 [Prevotella multiformis DSM 16608]
MFAGKMAYNFEPKDFAKIMKKYRESCCLTVFIGCLTKRLTSSCPQMIYVKPLNHSLPAVFW